MSLDIELIKHDQYMEVLVSGIFDVQEAIDKFPAVLSLCRSLQLSKVLVDYRNVKGIPAATEKILYTLKIQNHYEQYISSGGRLLKIAYVGKSPSVSTYEPGMKIVKDNNLPFDLFTDINEAYKWLNVNSV